MTATAPLKAYWQPGCSSCLRMKEFLQRHGVVFESINVLADKEAFADLARLGIRSVPIIRRGDDWANGQVLRDVARIAGIDWGGSRILPPAELKARLDAFLAAARRFLAQLPDDKLAEMLPNRPRSYASLAYHIFSIADAFLDHELKATRLDENAYNRVPRSGEDTQNALLAYGEAVAKRLDDWWATSDAETGWDRPADVYYGAQTVHEFFERTTWHCGQHLRQFMMVLDRLGIEPQDRLGQQAFAGLPMPAKVWDDEPGAR
ncbi:MAG: glutaredoxin domain-containing protein [Burkholderiales bacterium]|nr:glutaredoxin domain-containing protein [Burkholderiales bacterium]